MTVDTTLVMLQKKWKVHEANTKMDTQGQKQDQSVFS